VTAYPDEVVRDQALKDGVVCYLGKPVDDEDHWALLPLVARNQVGGGPSLYGILLGAIGAGAVGAAFALPRLTRQFGADRLVAIGTLGTAASMMLFAFARQPITALAGSLIAGMSWIVVLATINVSAQVALPGWV
jgi:CheY-like chemotaxis protein